MQNQRPEVIEVERNVKELEACLEKRFRKRGYPGMSVCIRGPEGVLYEQGFGYRSIEHQKPVDADTVFGIASMSKSMTALACCILDVEGKMSLEDPVVKYFPNFHIPGAPDECITVRTLAMHRSGLPPMEPLEWSIAMNSKERDTHWYREMVRTAPNKMDRIEQIVDYITAGNYEPVGAPGEYMSYSNEGYAVLSYIVDQAAGITLEEFLKERIFEPLGMTRTVLDVDCSEARALAGDNITSLFERDDDGKLVWDDNWSILPPFRGCACVKSTAKDITKYYQMLSNGGVWEGKQVIPAEAVELMIGKAFPLREKYYYCMGLQKRLLGGKMVCQHAGGLHGVSTEGGLMEGGYGVAVLCNEGDVDVEDFQWICYNYILGLPLETEHYWDIPNGGAFSRPEMLCGDYLCHEGLPVHCIVEEKDGVLGGTYQDKPVVLRWCGQNIFTAVDAKDPAKRVTTLRFYTRNGSAWGVKCGSRIYQRVRTEEP